MEVLENEPAHAHSLRLSCIYKHIPLPRGAQVFLVTQRFSPGLDQRCIQVQSTDMNLGQILSARLSKIVPPTIPPHFAGCHRSWFSSHVPPGTTKGCHLQKPEGWCLSRTKEKAGVGGGRKTLRRC